MGVDSGLTQQIEREIEQAREKYGEKWGVEYFNNFGANLPGGYRRTDDPTSRALPNDARASEKIRNQSLAEFWAIIDATIEELGIDQKQIIEARNRFFKERDYGMFDLVKPIYTKLRELGYKHYPDLTS